MAEHRNTLPRPLLTEFMIRGIELADALTIIERWETLTERELVSMRFKTVAHQDGPVSPASPPRFYLVPRGDSR